MKLSHLVSLTVLAFCLVGLPSPALADCVDYSPARARAAQEAVLRKPPTAAQLGVPSLDGLTMDVSGIGDPACSGAAQLPRYTSTEPLLTIISNWHSNIRRRTNTDGMNRQWFENPRKGDDFYLTSGTEVDVIGLNESTGKFAFLRLTPPAALAPLSVEQQPYSARDIAEGTPWPGGGSGPRQFVRADGGDAGYRAPNNNSYAGGAAATGPAGIASAANANCPPPSSGQGNAGSQIGAAIGGEVLGGGAGRQLGAAIGGLGGMLGRRAQPAPTQPTPAGCPQ